MSSHSSQSATSKAPIVVVDMGSSPSLDPHPVQSSLGVSSRTRFSHSLVVKELNWTTSKSSKEEGTLGPQVDVAAVLEGNLEELTLQEFPELPTKFPNGTNSVTISQRNADHFLYRMRSNSQQQITNGSPTNIYQRNIPLGNGGVVTEFSTDYQRII